MWLNRIMDNFLLLSCMIHHISPQAVLITLSVSMLVYPAFDEYNILYFFNI